MNLLRKKRRMNLSSSYIGAGNQASVFNRKAKIPFKQLKSIYGEELALLKVQQSDAPFKNHILSETDRVLLMQKIRETIKEQRRKSIINLILTLIIITLLIFGVLKFVF